MSPHISFHPIGTDVIRRYVGYLSTSDPAGQAGYDYDAASLHDRFYQSYVDMARAAPTLTGSFDTTHGLNLAVSQGFFGHYHYLHDARLSAIADSLAPYTQQWHEVIPSWPATKSATNRLGDEPSSGVFIAAAKVGQLMNDAHANAELTAALAGQFPGEKLQVLWAALTDAYESGRALLEASGVIEPDPHELANSACRTNQTNCEPTGLRLYLKSAPAATAPPPPAAAPPPPAALSQPAPASAPAAATPPPPAWPPSVAMAPAVGVSEAVPERKMPDAPSLSERMRERANNPELPGEF